jgi:hypothetical protein
MSSQIAALLHRINAEAIDSPVKLIFFQGCFQCLIISFFHELIVAL